MDIDTMEAGKEINQLVGIRVMGWHISRSEIEWLDDNERHVGNIFTISEDREDLRGWSPSTDIRHAWQVVEAFETGQYAKRRVAACMYLNLYDWVEPPTWRCTFLAPDLAPVYAWADTAPLAICRAALKAVGG